MMTELAHWLEHHLLACPFKASTGLDCPGCGMQRSLLCLLKGEWVNSFLYHPAGIPTVAMVVLLIAHLRFKFTWGAKTLTILYLFVASLTVGHYILKWMYGFDFLSKHLSLQTNYTIYYGNI